jgi:hypothetical protein
MKGQVKTMFRYEQQSSCYRLLLQSATGWPFHITSRCWKVDIVNIHHLHFCLGCTRQSTYWVGDVFLHSVVSRELISPKLKQVAKGYLKSHGSVMVLCTSAAVSVKMNVLLFAPPLLLLLFKVTVDHPSS